MQLRVQLVHSMAVGTGRFAVAHVTSVLCTSAPARWREVGQLEASSSCPAIYGRVIKPVSEHFPSPLVMSTIVPASCGKSPASCSPFRSGENASAGMQPRTHHTMHFTWLCAPGLPTVLLQYQAGASSRTDQSKLIVLYVGTLDLIAKSAAGPPLASIVCSALIT